MSPPPATAPVPVPDAPAVAARLTGIRLVYDGTVVLDQLDWEILTDQRWVVLGPNGAGKTTLVRILSMYQHPSAGEVEVLGARLGSVDIRGHRRRIGLASSAMADLLRPGLAAIDVVMTAKHAALETWWHDYDEADRVRAQQLLERFGAGALADRPFVSLSSGERQRVQLARTLMSDPGLVILDEPTAGLDLGGKEDLVARMGALAADPTAPPQVLVTHHVDEIPATFTHLLLLRPGGGHLSGPIGEVLTGPNLSSVFGIDVRLEQMEGRWFAWARA